jgi:PAS domain S-box-containing protein
MNENFHRDFVENLALGAYRTTPEGKIEYANKALAKLLDYASVEQLMETNSRDFYVDLNHRKQWLLQMEKSPEGSLVYFTTNWRRKLDSRVILVQNCARTIRDSEGRVMAFEGVVLDITEYPRPLESPHAHEILKQAEHWTEAEKDALFFCILRKDKDRRIVWANKAYCQREHVTLETLLNEKYTDELLYGKAFDEIYGASDAIVLQSRKPYVATEHHPFGDGTTRFVQVVKVPLLKSDGTVGGIEIFFWDADPLVPMAMQEERVRAQRLLESAYSVEIQYDMSGKITRVNPAAIELTGRAEKEWIGKHYSEIVAPEFQDVVTAKIKEKWESLNPRDVLTCYELDILNADGTRTPMEVASRLLIQGTTLTGVVACMRDLSKQKKRLLELHHRIKNSLGTIYAVLGSEKVLAEHDQTRNALEAAQERVLAISELHKALYRSEQVDQIEVGSYINDLIQQLVRSYRRSWQDVEARVSVDGGILMHLNVLTPLALVLHELISNSMKHAFPPKPEGGTRHGNIFVSISRRGSDLRLQVSDNGLGMPDGFLPRKARTLGMRLLFGFVEEQLEGEVQLDWNTRGTSCLIVISLLDTH